MDRKCNAASLDMLPGWKLLPNSQQETGSLCLSLALSLSLPPFVAQTFQRFRWQGNSRKRIRTGSSDTSPGDTLTPTLQMWVMYVPSLLFPAAFGASKASATCTSDHADHRACYKLRSLQGSSLPPDATLKLHMGASSATVSCRVIVGYAEVCCLYGKTIDSSALWLCLYQTLLDAPCKKTGYRSENLEPWQNCQLKNCACMCRESTGSLSR